MHILIADDDLATRMELGGRLKQWGCRVTHAKDAMGAIQAIGTCPEIDLIIVNWMMPGMDGMLFSKAIKAGALHAQTLVMVGGRFRCQVEAEFPSWADGYISKPLDFKALRELLTKLAAINRIPTA